MAGRMGSTWKRFAAVNTDPKAQAEPLFEELTQAPFGGVPGQSLALPAAGQGVPALPGIKGSLIELAWLYSACCQHFARIRIRMPVCSGVPTLIRKAFCNKRLVKIADKNSFSFQRFFDRAGIAPVDPAEDKIGRAR